MTFWGTVNKITAKTREIIPPQRDKETDKVVASTTTEIANHLHKHFIRPVKQINMKKDIYNFTIMLHNILIIINVIIIIIQS